MSEHQAPIVTIKHLGDEGYSTKLDPTHDDFDKSLITDPKYLREQAGFDEYSVEHEHDVERESDPSDPDVELGEDSLAPVVDSIIGALEDDPIYGPLLKGNAAKRQLEHGSLFYDALLGKANELAYDFESAKAVVAWVKLREEMGFGLKRSAGRSMGLSEFAAIQYPPLTWIVEGLIPADGPLGVDAAYAKTGKSTKIAGILRSIALGVPFCGLAVKQVPVLYVNMEERPADVQRRLIHKFGIPADNKFVRLDFGGDRWSKKLEEGIYEEVVLHGYKLIIWDTLSKLWDVKDENDNAEVKDWMSAFQKFSHKLQVTNLLIHNSGKGGGQNGTSLRGASAIADSTDFIWEYGRVEKQGGVDEEKRKSLRKLSTLGRYSEDMVDEMFLEFNKDSFEYSRFVPEKKAKSSGNGLAQTVEAARDKVADMLCSGEAYSNAEIAAATGKSDRTVERKAESLLGEGYTREQDGEDAQGRKRFKFVPPNLVE